MHLLHFLLDKIKVNMEACTEEQDERFHQDNLRFDKHFRDVTNASTERDMMGDYIWELIRETSTKNSRKTKTVNFK